MQGNIVSCTKNQIRLWTVNGTLLAETPLILTSSVKVLCCAVSEVSHAPNGGREVDVIIIFIFIGIRRM